MVAPNDLIFFPTLVTHHCLSHEGRSCCPKPIAARHVVCEYVDFLFDNLCLKWLSFSFSLTSVERLFEIVQFRSMTVSVSFISVPNSQDLSFSMVSRAAKKNVLNPDLAESEDVCLHITQKSSGNPLCDPLHDPSWLRGPALVISMARKCPIYGPSDHVQLRWARDLYLKNPWIQGILTCINHSDQGEVPELDGAFNGKVIDLNEGFPASHVSVPEGMI